FPSLPTAHVAWVAGSFGAVPNAWSDATPGSDRDAPSSFCGGETPGARFGSDSPKENPLSAAAGDVRASSDLSRQASELSQLGFRLRFSYGAELIRPRRIRRWFATVDTSLIKGHKGRT